MRNRLKFCLALALILAPRICFSWGEGKHPISELLIHHVYLDSNYVFCGSDASWGSNAFGLFVFDRKTESWTNYSTVREGHPKRFRQVKEIERDGDFVLVTVHGDIALRFDTRNGSCEQTKGVHIPFIRDFPLSIDGVEYRIHFDSVIVQEDSDNEVHVAPVEQALKVRSYPYEPEPPHLILSHPVPHDGRIYMPFDLCGDVMNISTKGIVIFDIDDKTFRFFPSDIFQGTVMGGFARDSSIIFYTAKLPYEANAQPASGFVKFDPADFTFSLWAESPLPEEPLAIFDVAQDDKEYWIGTDKGVFRIDKKTKGVKQYQIAWGIVSKDMAWVHSACGSFERNPFPVVAELDRGRDVDILAVWNGWCEIKSPRNIAGFVEGKYVEGVTLSEDSDQICKFKPLDNKERIPVRVSDESDAELMVELDANSSREHEYTVIARIQKRNQPVWYKIKLPTAWINMDDLVFQLGEVE